MFKEGWQIAAADVAILIDGGGQDFAPVIQVPRGVVGAPAEKGNAKRRSADQHGCGNSLCIQSLFPTFL